MKPLIILAGLLLGAGPLLAGYPVGRGELGFGVTADGTYDSNVFGTTVATADHSVTLTPVVNYIREAARITVTASAGVAFLRYAEQKQLDVDNLSGNFQFRLDEGGGRKFAAAFGGAYLESSDVNTDLNTRVRSKSTTFTALASLLTGPRTDLRFTGIYNNIDRSAGSNQRTLNTDLLFHYNNFLGGYNLRLGGAYAEVASSGHNTLGVPLNQTSYQAQVGLERLFHNVLHVWFGYGYRVLDRSAAETAARATRQAGPVLTLSLDGPFLPQKYFPKVKSSFTLEYSDAAAPGINDPGSKALSGRLGLDWQARENTSVGLALTRGQRLSAEDLTVLSSTVQLSLSQKFRYNLNGKLGAAYGWETYRIISRADRILSFNGSLIYTFARRWSAGLAYRYTSATSTRAESVFNRHVTTLTLGYQF